MTLHNAIIIRLKEILKTQNKTAYQVYMSGGMAKSTLYDTLSGTKKRVTVATLYEICDSLGISLKYFFDSPLFDDVED